MVFGTAVGLELGLLLLYYREGLRFDLWCLVLRWDSNWPYCSCVIGNVWNVIMVFGTMVWLEFGLLLLYYREGLRSDLWCLLLRWDRNWAYCCCVIGSVWDVTYGVWYCSGTRIGLLMLYYRGSELWLIVFGTAVGLEFGLLLLCYRECLRFDLWCLVLLWDRNWANCCCVIGRIWDMTYVVCYYGATKIGLIAIVL